MLLGHVVLLPAIGIAAIFAGVEALDGVLRFCALLVAPAHLHMHGRGMTVAPYLIIRRFQDGGRHKESKTC